MKKHSTYFGFLFSIICVVLFFPGSVLGAVLEFPDPASCYVSPTYLNHSSGVGYFYFVSSAVPFLDPTGGLQLQKIIEGHRIKCVKLDATDDRVEIEDMVGILNIGQQDDWQNDKLDFFWMLRAATDVPKEIVALGGADKIIPEDAATNYLPLNHTLIGCSLKVQDTNDPEIMSVGGHTQVIYTNISYEGLCVRYFKFKGSAAPWYVYYLGNTHNPNLGSLGGLTWTGDVITVTKGQKTAYTMTVTSDTPGVELQISCENCVKNNIIITGDSAEKNTILLTVDPEKLTDEPIDLRARTIGPAGAPYFETKHEVKIKVADVDCGSLTETQCVPNDYCWYYPDFGGNDKCIAKTLNVDCSKLKPEQCGKKDGSSYCTYLETTNTCTDYLSAPYENSYGTPDGYDSKLLPPCAFTGSCRNINDLLQLAINIGKYALGLIGSAALAFFVYGGFMMIISAGNAERVKKGRDILVAAIVGIVIAFSAYALINFVLDALDVSSEYRVVDQIK
ncbi:MAG: hypothetical protein CO030_04085 [Candidatus Magasanikbacteria bacterium CG_4_9_14_0_2_um_filter_42_11]|uniref:Uncharacterized protein n=1 Tax=Candidatus Magasanikbacteria bacterium CG_4_9_14_0_2_um_filter_42_11 TaxID=1974643 RepID=A0A2M8F945_9BACT|nr:MAG: hypothetical protein COY70_00620 [Candidatus Magasanikbacteria bacterium CG_4_10_14_0_8_um_filter_42_12]PJC52199.1 MAG: hypothetical protein CO030_04085 [Candidatus Magasanikbacteria bacterium CG_4_9_14_0_2_um_filter_42_11]